ncbi:MAG: YceI family protein [Myxococcota bacterium]
MTGPISRGLRLSAMLAFAASLASAAPTSAQSRELSVERARCQFRSEAQLETINGVSRQASGSVSFDPANVAATRGRLTVPVRSLQTGIEERDEHLYGSEWLNAGEHPNIVFEITGVSGASRLAEGEDADLEVRGNFTMNGVTRPVTARVRVRWDGSGLRGRAQFRVRLEDHGVSVPSVVRLKVANEITIRMDFAAG